MFKKANITTDTKHKAHLHVIVALNVRFLVLLLVELSVSRLITCTLQSASVKVVNMCRGVNCMFGLSP